MSCQEYFPKDKLLKFVLNKSSQQDITINLDEKNNIPARSAYLCKSQNCLDIIQSNKNTQKIIRRHLKINSPQITESFLQQVREFKNTAKLPIEFIAGGEK